MSNIYFHLMNFETKNLILPSFSKEIRGFSDYDHEGIFPFPSYEAQAKLVRGNDGEPHVDQSEDKNFSHDLCGFPRYHRHRRPDDRKVL